DGRRLGLVEQHFGVANEDGIAAVGPLVFDRRPYPLGYLVARAVFCAVIDGFRGRADADITRMNDGLFQAEVAVLELLIVWDGIDIATVSGVVRPAINSGVVGNQRMCGAVVAVGGRGKLWGIV